MDDSKESQNVAHLVRSPLNFLRDNFGSFILVMCELGGDGGHDNGSLELVDVEPINLSCALIALPVLIIALCTSSSNTSACLISPSNSSS